MKDSTRLDPRRLAWAALPMICAVLLAPWQPTARGQVAIRGAVVHTMAGPAIEDGVVLIREGKIAAVGKAGAVEVPDGYRELEGRVVTPGLIDAHSTVGLSGLLNHDHDQDQLETASPIQPQLRAIDAYNAREELVAWIRNFGVTTIHTGHAPGELVSGQTMIVKTRGNTVEEALLRPARAVAVTLASSARKSADKSPGTRGKMMAMLRSDLLRAQRYLARRQAAETGKEEKSDAAGSGDEEHEPPETDLAMETLAAVLRRELALLITADRAQDITNALRLAEEFRVVVWLDSAAEAYLLIDEIRKASVPVIIHPTMARATGDRENLSFETAAKLIGAGIPVAIQSGYESYVPKTRVALFEAALAARHGLSFEQALAAVTINAARILEIDDRVGSLEVGKDGDVALYDGDPFEFTTHCVGVVIDGQVLSDQPH